MIKTYTLLLLITALPAICFAGQGKDTLSRDTAKHLTGLTVKGYLSLQPVLSVPASVSVLSPAQLALQPENSLLSAMNTVPGVRMEERSPGSYRLSIRGSLLRSPFGVRDVKIYFDELPLTDAGGNTYLNAVDAGSVQGIEILKGPDGSLFGANSGGVVLISPVARYNDSSYLSADLNAGSYGLFHQRVSLQNQTGKNQLNLDEAFESYGGYRQHSYMQRSYLQAADKLTFSRNDELKFLGFYSDMSYQTPGGLTLAQYQADPRQARPATKTVPGAISQQIGIYQKMLTGGFVNEWHLSDRLRNVTSVFGTYVDFKNPFITNYEQRYEGTYGLRSYFELSGNSRQVLKWKANLGLEWQQTASDINNYGNVMGARDTAQTLDKINTNQHFFFARYAADMGRLHLETALSLNFYDYNFRNVYPNSEQTYTNRNFTPQLMPRIAGSFQITGNFVWRASVSRGYSTPTTAEIRPTDNIINTSLGAEDGWNYETGLRLRNQDESMFIDASVFYYRLNNAIVQRSNPDETVYYVNAGGTSQPGLELYFTDWVIRRNNTDFIRGLEVNESVTLNRFTFSSYHTGTADYSGNKLTGVPGQVFVTSMQVKFPANVYVFVQHNYTASLPLNDANTAFADHYNLVEAKAGWEHPFNPKLRIALYAGAGNLLNEKYSLGNDLNAVGSRYYNAAPARNYYLGLKVML